VRPATLDDLPGALDVVVARDTADLGAPDFTLEDLRQEWERLDLDRDATVVEERATIVGVGWLRPREAVALVHPDAEGRGHGAELLAWSERRAVELGRAVHRQEAVNDRARALLEAAGYTRARSYWRMELDLSGVPPAARWPAGAAWRRPALPADTEALHAISEAAFAPVPDFESEPLERFAAEHLERHDAAPELSVVADDDEGIAGFALVLAWPQESTGHVDLLAVHPRAAGRGLGTALLRTAFAAIRDAGLTRATLGVAGDNPRAVALYERAGMSPGPRTDAYERPAG
jgi:mycothiol synthase